MNDGHFIRQYLTGLLEDDALHDGIGLRFVIPQCGDGPAGLVLIVDIVTECLENLRLRQVTGDLLMRLQLRRLTKDVP